MRQFYLLTLITTLLLLVSCENKKVITISFDAFGISPDTKEDASGAAVLLIEHLQGLPEDAEVTVTFPKGRYDFYEENAFTREYYISNHDQVNPKKVGFSLEGMKNITFDGQGSEFVFHGRMVPFALLNGENIELKNFAVDFELPALRQLEIKAIDVDKDELLAEMIVFSKKVAKAIEKVIPCNRIAVMVLGLEVPHAHIHLLPIQSEKDIYPSASKLKLTEGEFADIAAKIRSYVS